MDQNPFGGVHPPDQLFELTSIRLDVDEGEHPFHLAARNEAQANWARELTAKPQMFDGKVVLQREVSLEGGALVARGHLVPFSTFLWWRRTSPDTGFQIFGFPVVVSKDGAIIAIEMAEHTANAGQVYCAAGSLDGDDVVDGQCDLLGNMLREVREETGLDLTRARDDGRWLASHAGRRLVIYRVFHMAETADELLRAIESHRISDPEPEIAGAVAIRSADPNAHPYNPMMLPLLRWFFASRG